MTTEDRLPQTTLVRPQDSRSGFVQNVSPQPNKSVRPLSAAVALSVNGALVATHTYPLAPTDTLWDIGWTPPAPGNYTLVATLIIASGNISATRMFTIMPDNDLAGIQLSATASNIMVGETTVVTIRLQSNPTADVRVTFTSDTPEVCSVTPEVELNETNWQSGAPVVITGRSSGTCVISSTTTSNDQQYANLQVGQLRLTIEALRWHVILPIITNGGD